MLPLLNEYYEKMIADGLTKSTARQTTTYCRYFAKWYGSDNIRKVTRKDLEKYKLYLVAEHKTRFWATRLKASSVSARLYVLKGYFKFLLDRKVIFLNPTVDLTIPRYKKFADTHLLTEKEIEELLRKPDVNTLLGIRDRLIFELFYTTALRNNELCQLKISGIDMKEKYIYPPRSKGGRECAIPILSSIYPILRKYIDEIRPQILVFIRKPDIPELFITKRGTAFDTPAMNKLFLQYRDGNKNVHPHALRHSCATHMLKNGADIRNIQALLGHNRLETTQGYTRLVINDLKIIHDKHHPREIFFRKMEKLRK